MGSLQDSYMTASWDRQVLRMFFDQSFPKDLHICKVLLNESVPTLVLSYFYNNQSFSLKCLLSCIQLFCFLPPQLEFWTLGRK